MTLERGESNMVEFEPEERPQTGSWRRVIVTSEVNGGEYCTETVVIVAEDIVRIRVESVE